MINRIILISVLTVIGIESFSQRTITCKVVDATLKKPVGEAFVRIVDKDISTTTNHLGFFQLSVDSADVISVKADNFEILTFTPPPVNSFQVELNWFRFSFYEQGTEAFYNFIGKNIRYPYNARSTFTQGQLFLSFQINDDGKMVNLKLINDIGKGCGKELLRVIKKVPGKFIPSKTNETYILPVTFRISNHNAKVSDTIVQLPAGVKILSEVIITATIQ